MTNQEERLREEYHKWRDITDDGWPDRDEIAEFLIKKMKEEISTALDSVVEELEKMKEEGRVGTGWTQDGTRMTGRFDEIIKSIALKK